MPSACCGLHFYWLCCLGHCPSTLHRSITHELPFWETKGLFADGQFGAYMQVNLQNDGPVTIPLEAVPAVVSLFHNAITLTLHLLSHQNYLTDTCQQCSLGMWNSGCHKIWCSYVWHMYMLRQSYIDGQGGFEDIHTYGCSPSITVRYFQKSLLGAGRKFDFFCIGT